MGLGYYLSEICHLERKKLLRTNSNRGKKILIGFKGKLVAINPLGLKKGKRLFLVDIPHIESDWTMIFWGMWINCHADALSHLIRLSFRRRKRKSDLQMTTMTGREDAMEEKPKVKILTPSFGIDKARLSGSGFRSKGFAITDLLGLESELQPHQSGPGGGGNSDGPNTGIGGFSFAGGSLPLGLGFLCSLAAQQPPGAPCFLPSHIPLLQSRTESQFMQNLEQQRDAYSGSYLGLRNYKLYYMELSTVAGIAAVLKFAFGSSLAFLDAFILCYHEANVLSYSTENINKIEWRIYKLYIGNCVRRNIFVTFPYVSGNSTNDTRCILKPYCATFIISYFTEYQVCGCNSNYFSLFSLR